MDENAAMEQYKKLPRLYVEAGFGGVIMLREKQSHYLRNVMRLSPGDGVRVFNGRDGEWLATLEPGKGREAALLPARQIRAQATGADIWLLASPLKKEPFEFMIEKASELGIARFFPVLCDHTAVRRFNEDRARLIAIESAEQCERLDIMRIDPLRDLSAVLKDWPAARPLLFCRERAAATPIAAAPEALSLLTGPEGGFSFAEVEAIAGHSFVTPVSLGSLILRAETAACAGVSCIQALWGDWRGN